MNAPKNKVSVCLDIWVDLYFICHHLRASSLNEKILRLFSEDIGALFKKLCCKAHVFRSEQPVFLGRHKLSLYLKIQSTSPVT